MTRRLSRARSWLVAWADPGRIKRFRRCPKSYAITDPPVWWPGRLPAIVCARRRPFARTMPEGGELMGREFNVGVERDAEGFYVASVPTLHGCHTQARSLDELMERIKEAIALCLEDEDESTETLEFVGVQRVRLASCPASPASPGQS